MTRSGKQPATYQRRGSTSNVAPAQAHIPALSEHQWLTWASLSDQRKVEYNERLEKHLRKDIEVPRYVPNPMFGMLGIRADMSDLMRLVGMQNDENGNPVDQDFSLWFDIFDFRDPVCREWCLEFYSTIDVRNIDKVKNIFDEKCIFFHCGGRDRALTIVEFGVATGMYTQDLVDNNPVFQKVLRLAARTGMGFPEGDQKSYYTRISGGQVWDSKKGANTILSPVLRLFHKMITYLVVQRSNQRDKIYIEDLWLLRLFHEGAPYRTACAPYIVAKHMGTRGMRDRKIVCGHYVTRLVRYFGCEGDRANVGYNLTVKEMIPFDYVDLKRFGLIKKQTHRDIYELIDFGDAAPEGEDEEDEEEDDDEDEEMDEAVEEQPARRPKRRATTTMGASSSSTAPAGSLDLYPLQHLIDQMLTSQQTLQNNMTGFQSNVGEFQGRMDSFREQVGGDLTMMGSGLGRVIYDSRRYQPLWETQLRGQEFRPPADIPDYRPPVMFIPNQRVGGGFYFPPEHVVEEPPRHDPGASGPDMPVRFGTYTGSYAGMDVSQAGAADQSFAEQVVGSFFDYSSLPGYQHYPPHPPPQ